MQKTLIYIDINTKGQIDASGNAIKSSSLYPSFERGQWQVLCINFVQVTEDDLGIITLTPYNLSGKSYLFVADNNFADDDSLMLKSYQSTTPFNETDPTSNRINIAGDWMDGGTADLSKGQMSIRVNSDTTKFVEAIGNKVSITSGLYINIKQYIAGLSNPSSIAWIPFVAKNTVRDWGDAQETPPSGEQVVSFINSYFSTPIVYEFSTDGENWHTIQGDNDVYYRQRFNVSGTQWSTAVKMITGQAAPLVMIQYSVDGIEWSDISQGASFVRFSVDNGETWESPLKTIGPQGPQGLQGLQGIQGERGEAFKVDATGTMSERSQYDSAEKGFSFLSTDDGCVYIKSSNTSGDWSAPIPFKGDKGDKPFNLKGVWVSGTTYAKDDAVTYNGSMFVATTTTTATPGSDDSWLLYVSKGTPGKDGDPLESNYIDIEGVYGEHITVDAATVPVAVEINNSVYPITGMVKEDNTFKIPVAPILAAANLASYDGVWRVWRAGGRKGDNGSHGGTFAINIVSAIPENPDPTALYLIPME